MRTLGTVAESWKWEGGGGGGLASIRNHSCKQFSAGLFSQSKRQKINGLYTKSMWNHSCEQFSSCRAFQLNQKTENQRSIYQTNVESFLRTVLCWAFQLNQKTKNQRPIYQYAIRTLALTCFVGICLNTQVVKVICVFSNLLHTFSDWVPFFRNMRIAPICTGYCPCHTGYCISITSQ